MTHPWYPFCLKEIDHSRKKLTVWEEEFIKGVREKITRNIALTPKQEDQLVKIHQRMTDVFRHR